MRGYNGFETADSANFKRLRDGPHQKITGKTEGKSSEMLQPLKYSVASNILKKNISIIPSY